MNSKQRKQADKMKLIALQSLAKEGNNLQLHVDTLKMEARALEGQVADLRKRREALRESNSRLADFEDTVRDVLVLLELEESPEEISLKIRERYGFIGDW